MSRQSSIENYFKSKASTSSSPKILVNNSTMCDKKIRKRNLSLTKPLTLVMSPKVKIEGETSFSRDSGNESNTTPTKHIQNTTKRKDHEIQAVTPTKCPKVENDRTLDSIVDLCSDDEDLWRKTPEDLVSCVDLTLELTESENASDCSQKTILYSPEKKYKPSTVTPESWVQEHSLNIKESLPSTPTSTNSVESPLSSLTAHYNETPQKVSYNSEGTQHTPKSSTTIKQENDNQLNNSNTKEEPSTSAQSNEKLQNTPNIMKTPRKSPHYSGSSNTPQSSNAKSPHSKHKFFSPTKKRSVTLKSASKVKRSLSKEMSGINYSRIVFEEDLFAVASQGMDDKTIFLLDIINKYLFQPSLRPLLDEESQNLLINSLQVVKPGMRLVCRLYWRKEGWYKKEQIIQICSEGSDPMDDPTLQEMLQSLLEHKLIVQSSNKHMSFEDLSAILKKDELKQICKELKLKMSSKQDAIEALASFSRRTSNISNFVIGHTSSNSQRVLKMMCMKAGACYMLSELARNTLNKLYLLMYLGMDYNIIREKRLELLLLYDKINRETYPIDKDIKLDNASVVFRTRDEFERYFTAHNIYEGFLISTDLASRCNTVAQVYYLYKSITEEEMASYTSLLPWLRRYTPAYLYIKILESGIQDLKRDKSDQCLLLAKDILDSLIKQPMFRQHKKAEWYAEKALILHSLLYQYDEAGEALLEGFQSDMSEEAKDSMRPRARKIANQKNITLSDHIRAALLEYANKEAIREMNIGGRHIYKQPMDYIGNKRGKLRFEVRTSDGRTVQDAEEYCISEYLCSGEFTEGEHWEGRIVTTIFFLLFWEIIYSQPFNVRGVFLSYYQRYPLDLFTDSFYENRKEIIDEWLNQIEASTEEQLIEMLKCAWEIRPEQELSGMSRGGMSVQQVCGVSRCLGVRGVRAVCARLAQCYRYAHAGFPDLTLWNLHTKRIKFVEVKTDSDKPSMKQIQWMQYLREHGIDTEFCYVGVHTTRQRCRVKKPEELPIATEI